MVTRSWWCVFLSVLLIVVGAGSTRAVEYGDMVQKDGKWVFQSTEDPIFKLMQTKGLITDEEYFKASAQTGKNWKETADAVLILERETRWNRYLSRPHCTYPIGWTWASKIGPDLNGMTIPGDPPKQVEADKPIPRWFSDPGCVWDWAMAPSGFSLKGRIHGPTGTMPKGIL